MMLNILSLSAAGMEVLDEYSFASCKDINNGNG